MTIKDWQKERPTMALQAGYPGPFGNRLFKSWTALLLSLGCCTGGYGGKNFGYRKQQRTLSECKAFQGLGKKCIAHKGEHG